MPPRERIADDGASPERGLAFPNPTARRLSLERQKRDLLKRIRAKKKEVARLERAVETAEALFRERVLPLVERCRDLNREIREAFEAMLAFGLTKREARAVRKVYRALLREGILIAREDETDPEDDTFDEAEAAANHARRKDEADDEARSRDPGPPPKQSEPGRESLAALFKRLAFALHPDRVQNAAEKEERTVAMKGVVQAYRRGDLEGLFEIERTWAVSATAGQENEKDDLALEHEVRALGAQLVELRRTARDLRSADALQFVPESAPRRGKSSLDRFVSTLEGDLDELVKIRDLVLAFQRREITLAQFLDGPDFEFGGEEFDFDDLLNDLLEEAHTERGRKRGARRTQRRR